MRTFDEIRADISASISINDAAALRVLAVEMQVLGTPDADAVAFHALGMVDKFSGAPSSAIEHFRRAMSAYEALGNRVSTASMIAGIGQVFFEVGDYASGLDHYRRALAIFEELGVRHYAAKIYSDIGRVSLHMGDKQTALEHFRSALAVNEELDDRVGIAQINFDIGNLYLSIGNYPTALEQFVHVQKLFEEQGNRFLLAGVICNIGLLYFNMGNYAFALESYERSLAVCLESDNKRFASVALLGIGNVHKDTGDHVKALDYYQRAMDVKEEIGDHVGKSFIAANVIEILLDTERFDEASVLLDQQATLKIDAPTVRASHCKSRAKIAEHADHLDAARDFLLQALQIVTEADIRADAANFHEQLRDLAKKRNDFDGYIYHNTEFLRIAEEVHGKETTQKIAMMEADKKMEAERRERDKERALLYGALPESVATRMLRGENVSGDHYEQASVIFMDIVGFTTHSSELDATVVVNLLQNIFSSFDVICAKHDVTKIKTIGDSYMAVAFDVADAVGARPRLAREQTEIANQIANSEQRVANVALAMMASEFVWPHTGERVMFRIGMHCGPVTAGVIGTQRLQYDVWGDTVNVASRMESTSEPGRIHVSEALAVALSSPPSPLSHASLERGSYTVIPRGTIDVKGKGTMQTYWLE